MEPTAAATDPQLTRRIESRVAKLSRFALTDAPRTPGRLRKPFSQKTWLSLPADIRLKHLRITVAKQVEEEHAERVATKAATPTPAPSVTLVASAPVAVPRYATLCHSCGDEVAVYTPAPRVTYCKRHEADRDRKRGNDV